MIGFIIMILLSNRGTLDLALYKNVVTLARAAKVTFISIGLLVCLFIILVCLLAVLRRNAWKDFHEFFRIGRTWYIIYGLQSYVVITNPNSRQTDGQTAQGTTICFGLNGPGVKRLIRQNTPHTSFTRLGCGVSIVSILEKHIIMLSLCIFEELLFNWQSW